MRRAVQDFFLRPAARKEEGNAAQIHHADGVSENVTGMIQRRPPILRMSCS
jgi:hypothetical protein